MCSGAVRFGVAIVGAMAYSTTTAPSHDGGQMPAHLWTPEGGTGPGLVLFQEIFGITRYIRRRAQDLADAGYVVLAPEIYWRLDELGPFPFTPIEPAMETMAKLDRGAAVIDGASAVEHLRGLDEVTAGTGVIGFCFGGGLAFTVAAYLEAAEGGGQAVDVMVDFYGSALRELVDTMTVEAPSLHHFGLADSYIDAESVRRVEAAVTRQPATTFHTYEGADHAFDNPDGPLHHPEASRLAWCRTAEWLGEHLPTR